MSIEDLDILEIKVNAAMETLLSENIINALILLDEMKEIIESEALERSRCDGH